jgi:hypothetical protein
VQSIRCGITANTVTIPANERKLLQQFGDLPAQSKLAVLIGRAGNRDEYHEAIERRRRFVPDVEIITYDKILETQDL